MDESGSSGEKKLKLGKRSFEKVNSPVNEPDPNDPYRILGQNLQRDPSLELVGIDEEIKQQWRQRRWRDLKVFLFLAVIDGACLGAAAAAHWSPYLAVPLVSAGSMISVATLWIVYVVNR